jgi:hypothetical protein
MVYHRGRYGAFKVSSILHCPKTMKNSCILTLLVDSFRQFDQNQSVVNYFLFFEVHITLGFKSEVNTFISSLFDWLNRMIDSTDSFMNELSMKIFIFFLVNALEGLYVVFVL